MSNPKYVKPFSKVPEVKKDKPKATKKKAKK